MVASIAFADVNRTIWAAWKTGMSSSVCCRWTAAAPELVVMTAESARKARFGLAVRPRTGWMTFTCSRAAATRSSFTGGAWSESTLLALPVLGSMLLSTMRWSPGSALLTSWAFWLRS
jgi:hypothetical protein